MTRRALFRRLASAAIGVALMRTLPGIAPGDLHLASCYPSQVQRADILHGFVTFSPAFAVRVQG